ncbi:hypothetical protein EHQ53_11500 [Leptospira langatensis]|uniref:Uncharacterized protein n=1 Tax=Leptospira langatensis TaxID=2484983 RepID=A0A5F1ZSM3_9LEPT|nr:hypothetical protein [Leptospira langatensis]TGJ98829.1 hypothetical protein EHO57_15000 [Leptospira langatensis]TGL40604.1 hypothetical protein EHQ53_11500 [Leptospira langatensis]
MQISTAISDLVLAVSATWAGLRALSSAKGSLPKRGGAWGLFAVAAGAFLGVIFFLGGDWITGIYRFVVQFAGTVGIPWIGIAFFSIGYSKVSARNWYVLSAALAVLFILDSLYALGPYSTAIGAVAFVTVLVVSIQKYKGSHKTAALYGIAGALLFILGGLVIGTVGQIAGIPRVDIFHYVLAVAVYCLGYSQRNLG